MPCAYYEMVSESESHWPISMHFSHMWPNTCLLGTALLVAVLDLPYAWDSIACLTTFSMLAIRTITNLATQCWTTASWNILCPDICPDSLFLTVGAYYSDGARHQWISVEMKLVSHVEYYARDYDVGIIASNHCICTYTLYACEWWPPSHPPKIKPCF